jgi:hypothetical protein
MLKFSLQHIGEGGRVGKHQMFVTKHIAENKRFLSIFVRCGSMPRLSAFAIRLFQRGEGP